MKLSLVVMNPGRSEGQHIPVTLSQFIIGRDPQCNLRPASAIISKRHCALLVKNGQVSIRDFESTNGTFVNDVQVKGEVQLKNDDILKVGPLTFRVAIATRPAGAKQTPPPPPPKPSSATATDDDSVAAMLLSLQEDGEQAESTAAAGSNDIPAGSTIMDLVPFPGENKPGEASKDGKKAEEKKPSQVDPAHLAAKAILDKYTRRPRNMQ